MKNALEVGEILREKDSNQKVRIVAITPNYWGDGGDGYRLSPYPKGDTAPSTFWFRASELPAVYRRFADRPF